MWVSTKARLNWLQLEGSLGGDLSSRGCWLIPHPLLVLSTSFPCQTQASQDDCGKPLTVGREVGWAKSLLRNRARSTQIVFINSCSWIVDLGFQNSFLSATWKKRPEPKRVVTNLRENKSVDKAQNFRMDWSYWRGRVAGFWEMWQLEFLDGISSWCQKKWSYNCCFLRPPATICLWLAAVSAFVDKNWFHMKKVELWKKRWKWIIKALELIHC